jgi:thioredoxin-like negative regulator of GroEL
VNSLALIALWSVALGATDADNYAEAHQLTMKTGRPMLVMVSTDWCAPCQMMKKTIIPQVRQRGMLRRVAFAIVNPDRDQELANRLTDGGPVPQLVFYRKTSQGWTRRKLVGGQSVEQVEKFINEGLAEDEADPAAPEKAAPADKKVDTAAAKTGPTA